MTDLREVQRDLEAQGIDIVRLVYPDLLGVPRSKDVLVSELARVGHSGPSFCQGVFLTTHRGGVIDGPGGPSEGLPDLIAALDVDTIRPLPWDPGIAYAMADVRDTVGGGESGVSPRNVLKRIVSEYEAIGLIPVIGPELEFYLARRSTDGTYKRALDQLGRVYMNGALVDPDGIFLSMTRQLAGLGLGIFAANHEFSPAQFEINMWHGPAVEASDRAFLLKTAVKELAARAGLHATFMGKPWNDESGSGFHLHASVTDFEGNNLMADESGELTETAQHMIAGILTHAPALVALTNPTVNSYRRLQPDSLAPFGINWGHDNRTTMIRIPPERGSGTRLELRVGDGAAVPHIAVGALLAAALDGIRNKTPLQPPAEGWSYADEDVATVPTSLHRALDALEADQALVDILGNEMISTFVTLKRDEVSRYERWVSDWDIEEYFHHL